MSTPDRGQVTEAELVEHFDSLPPWTVATDLDEQEWNRHIEVARIVRDADPSVVEAALRKFVRQAVKEEYAGHESESKAFLLMRVLFELPERAPAATRRSFKGWVNWPAPDADGQVSLAWPVSWSGGRPRLVASYAGSMGTPYAAAEEYRYLRERFPYRRLEP